MLISTKFKHVPYEFMKKILHRKKSRRESNKKAKMFIAEWYDYGTSFYFFVF